ncbi:type II secretion system F family protein [Symbiobacterium thermophilum]|uniref:Type II secretion system protein GspF domain-containing protein n=2 Tax=Symbiobacterium thermophilum TaxID=2734 RepID=A0A953I1B1_SYMTR|nr:type II secretion system F family protein [Symbiobacterium thermophilum]MBY6275745.1 hypothetical protein [Symbiobacterium thermophilum]BAD39376.1 putative sercretion system protein [Symbiobacterium thermophilum IAM 14863]
MQFLAALCTFLAVALFLGGLAGALRRRSRLAERLLRERDPLEQEGTVLPRGPGWLERLEREAKQAGLNLSRRHFLLAFGASGGLAALLALAGDLLGAGACLLLGLIGPLLLIRHRARVRAARFAEQLPETLMLMASVIRAGGTLYQAVQTVVQQAPQPMRGEFERVARAMQLQVPAGDALGLIRDRVGLGEFTSVVVACKVAGEAGGDLDRVLESISRELVEDRQFLRAMEAACAEGKASARLVTAVPLVVVALVSYQNPAYFGEALTDPLGRVLLLGSLCAMALGWLLIRQITDVRTW